jgi:sirohydrochlorin ferrochelatase
MATPTLILVDNGSRRPTAIFSLRRLAASLSTRIGLPVHPVSLLHADRIPPPELGDRPALTFEPFLRQRLALGDRDFVVAPLFFGISKALTGFIPETVASLKKELGDFDLCRAEPLCPLPRGEPRLVDILHDNLRLATDGRIPTRVVLVDHGSPSPGVTAVRRHLAEGLRERLGHVIELTEAVMERRQGPEYDFNGPLLEQALEQMGRRDSANPIALSMLFVSPGRHAGPGGDIEQICTRVQRPYPNLRIQVSPLVGEHPGLVDILETRSRACL